MQRLTEIETFNKINSRKYAENGSDKDYKECFDTADTSAVGSNEL